jgi:hypothetical protein
MNILLLTPDAVGGTLLERLITIYAQFQNFDKPVIDVGHIELGIEKYFCPVFGREIANSLKNYNSKHFNFVKKQSIEDIIKILDSVDHYKVCKLPHYNMASRADSSDELAPFYQYLNNNFYIITCRRENLFEHAMSWALNKITKALNVYSVDQKIFSFYDLYQNKISIDPLSVVQALNVYKQYIDWTETHFQISSYYYYEKHLPNIENYIFSLPMFKSRKQLLSWKDVYGIDLNDWNRCHYYCSDIGSIALSNCNALPRISAEEKSEDFSDIDPTKSWKIFTKHYDNISDPSWPKLNNIADFFALPEYIQNECKEKNVMYFLEKTIIDQNLLDGKYKNASSVQFDSTIFQQVVSIIENNQIDFLHEKKDMYNVAQQSIEKMHKLNIIPQTVPIKKQKLNEKKFIVENFNECLDTYNLWIAENPQLGKKITDNDVDDQIDKEFTFWNPGHTKSLK